MSIELVCVALGGVLVLVQMLLAAGPRMMSAGVDWAMGPRDSGPPAVSLAAQRADRAFRNVLETYPVFAAAAIGVVVADGANGLSAVAAILYLVGRIVYVPAYIVPMGPLRSLVWGLSLLGIGLMLLRLLVVAAG
ncbi:MAPEG family protein [Acuticoccus sp. M5D2P5]|uniref:MAPEG family protein n=1 Tax=Acuticoccus kalidii TaxID=2910977 RepID=UPI001F18E234|nr:MAPEG family protein [Acuticoccus kalidii]MCF3935985.1 MAPEG family protein [Acuticoccus kalidii]